MAPGFPRHVEFHATPQNLRFAAEFIACRVNGHFSRFVNILVKFLVANPIIFTGVQCKNDCLSQLHLTSHTLLFLCRLRTLSIRFRSIVLFFSPLRQSMSTDSLYAHCSVFYNSTALRKQLVLL